MIKCSKHPKYQGIRKPKVDCPECWNIYNELHKDAKIEEENAVNDIAVEDSCSSLETYVSFDEIYTARMDKFKADLEELIVARLKKLRMEVDSICNMQWEYHFVPDKEFKTSMIDKKAKEGYRFKELWTLDMAKLYGLKEPVAVFERMVKK